MWLLNIFGNDGQISFMEIFFFSNLQNLIEKEKAYHLLMCFLHDFLIVCFIFVLIFKLQLGCHDFFRGKILFVQNLQLQMRPD